MCFRGLSAYRPGLGHSSPYNWKPQRQTLATTWSVQYLKWQYLCPPLPSAVQLKPRVCCKWWLFIGTLWKCVLGSRSQWLISVCGQYLYSCVRPCCNPCLISRNLSWTTMSKCCANKMQILIAMGNNSSRYRDLVVTRMRLVPFTCGGPHGYQPSNWLWTPHEAIFIPCTWTMSA